MDFTSIIGTLLGFVVVFVGTLLEGGHLGQIFQLSAAIIVVGGTTAATLLTTSPQDLKNALKLLPTIYRSTTVNHRELIQEIVDISGSVRKEGLLALEGQRGSIQDPLLRRSMKLVVDGLEPVAVKEILEADIEQALDDEENAARVFEAAGGYAPTIGIIGALLGLIQVMSVLNDPEKLGQGIAVAFVATLYGVALSNLLLLPWGAKLRRQALLRATSKNIVRQGVMGIQEGLSPHFLQEKLEAFLKESERPGKLK